MNFVFLTLLFFVTQQQRKQSVVFSFTTTTTTSIHHHRQRRRQQQQHGKNTAVTLLWGKNSNSEDDDKDDNDINSMRQRLEETLLSSSSSSYHHHPTESLFSDEGGQFDVAHRFVHPLVMSNNDDDGDDERSSPVLSSIARHRRETEIQILTKLHEEAKMTAVVQTLVSQGVLATTDNDYDDDYKYYSSNSDSSSSSNNNDNPNEDNHLLECLQNSWNLERGSKAAEELEMVDECLRRYHREDGSSSSFLLQMSEDRLHALIDNQNDPYWAEPFHRLSVVYYCQGRMEEARQLEEWVLSLKPWHIPALSNLVRIAEAQKNSPLAIQLASRRLPIVYHCNGNRRRIGWFQHALEQAKTMLQEQEERTKQLRNRMLQKSSSFSLSSFTAFKNNKNLTNDDVTNDDVTNDDSENNTDGNLQDTEDDSPWQ